MFANRPPTFFIAAWCLRAAPIYLILLMLAFDGSSELHLSHEFWFKSLFSLATLALLTYLQKYLHWQLSATIYLYLLLALLLVAPFGPIEYFAISAPTLRHSQYTLTILIYILTTVIAGMAIEVVIEQLFKLKFWAWWVAQGIAILYIMSVVFLLPGAIGWWCLRYWETRDVFRLSRR